MPNSGAWGGSVLSDELSRIPSGASVAYHASEMDDFYKLPILKVLGAMYFEGSMTLALKDMKVLDDILVGAAKAAG